MKILVVVDLVHSSPRIPELLVGLCQSGDHDLVVLCPDHTPEQLREIDLPQCFLSSIELVKTKTHRDSFEWIRRLLAYFRYSPSNSYSEQLKASLGNKSHLSRLIDLGLRWYQACFAIPDTERSWISLAKTTYREKLSTREFDCMLSSSPYPSVHFVARWIKRQSSILWIADFRDPWTLSHNYQLPPWRRLIDAYLEKKVIANSDVIVTVSDGVAKKLHDLHRRPVEVVPNGYRERLSRVNYDKRDKLIISYTGSIYHGKQNPWPFLQAVSNLKKSKQIFADDIEVNFYGRFVSELQKFIEDLAITDIVAQKGYVSRSEAVQIQERSDVLLMFNWEEAGQSGIFPLKFYEYLGSRRTILATGKDHSGEITKILAQTAAGMVICEEKGIETFVLEKVREIQRSGRVEYLGVEEAIGAYSYLSSARDLQQIITRLVPESESR